jgi:hypothetical protein
MQCGSFSLLQTGTSVVFPDPGSGFDHLRKGVQVLKTGFSYESGIQVRDQEKIIADPGVKKGLNSGYRSATLLVLRKNDDVTNKRYDT